MDGLTSIMKKVHADTIVKTKVYLFNVLKNPFERTDKECDDVEECHSLYLLDDFAETREKLEKKWAEYQQEMVTSNIKWEDEHIKVTFHDETTYDLRQEVEV